MEGMTFRLVPEKRKPGSEFINVDLVKEQLEENKVPSKDFKPGFRFTGLNDPTIFFDENHTRMVQNYRNAYMRLAVYYRSVGDSKDLITTLDSMNEKLPYKVLGMDNGLLFEVANLYLQAGDKEKYVEKDDKGKVVRQKEFSEVARQVAQDLMLERQEKAYRELLNQLMTAQNVQIFEISADVEKQALADLEQNPEDVNSYYNPYRILIETYENSKEYEKLLDIWQRLETMFPNDPTVKANIKRYQELTQPKDTTAK